MTDFLDNFLNKITMYRLVLYSLIALLLCGMILSAVNVLSYGALNILFSALFLTAVCWLINWLFAKAFEAQTNFESAYISALILALIITPAKSLHDYMFLFWAAALTMASKFILAAYKKHIFNPVAISVVLTSFILGQPASWWVGTASMLPLVLIIGILIVRKIQRWDLVFTFLATTLFVSLSVAFFIHSSVVTIAKAEILDSSLFFFAFIMLTEPLTTPPTKTLQIYYGIIVGLLFSYGIHLGNLYFTPELALVIGNVFSYIVSPKQKLMLKLKEKVKLSNDVYNFIFTADRKIKFLPGQYLEWTLGHKSPDSRGNRRYFTIASSPTENEIIMGVKFYPASSSFKKSLLALEPGAKILAGQLAGDFTMPKDTNKKLAFIAGGIGVTPFRSMVKYLSDKKEHRNVTVFYAGRKAEDLVYEDIFKEANEKLGISTFTTITQSTPGWNGSTGYITEKMIAEKMPDYKERLFYISGPLSMIENFQKTLHNMGVKNHNIKTDFFPGFV
jgi:ferredoxin-NADP reductase